MKSIRALLAVNAFIDTFVPWLLGGCFAQLLFAPWGLQNWSAAIGIATGAAFHRVFDLWYRSCRDTT